MRIHRFPRRAGVVGRLAAHEGGQVATIFALSLVPAAAMIGFGVDYTRAIQTRTKVQAAADAAALKAVSLSMAGASNDVAQSEAVRVFNATIGQASSLRYSSDSTPTVRVTNNSGTVAASVAFSGSAANMFSQLIGMKSVPINIATGATGGATIGANGSGQYVGSGSLSEDPVVRGADGSWSLFSCDVSGATWYNLLSDAGFEVNANCAGNSVWSEYYQVNVLAGKHTISLTPSFDNVNWLGTTQTGESWVGAVTVDGVAYAAPTTAGTTTVLNDTTAGITAKVVVGQPGVVGSSSNYVLIKTPVYAVSIAYDSDNIGSAIFGLADIQIAATNAGSCGVPGGLWGGTLGNVDDVNSNDFIVSGPNAQATQFTWNCVSAANANTRVRLTQ